MAFDEGELAARVAEEVVRRLAPVLEGLAGKPAPRRAEYLSLDEVASATGFSYDFVYDAVRGGDLPASQKSRRWRVASADLRAWMAKGRGGKQRPPRPEAAGLVRRHRAGLDD